MKPVKAKRYISSYPIRLSGNIANFDDNVIGLQVQVTDGPENFLARKIMVEISISDLVSNMPVDTAIALYRELVEKKVDRMSAGVSEKVENAS
jgi:hypothetical protein